MYILNKEYLDTIFKDNETLVYQDYDCGSMDINIGPQPGGANIFLCYFKTWNINDFPLTIGFGGGIRLPDRVPVFNFSIGFEPANNFFIGVVIDYTPSPPVGPPMRGFFGFNWNF